MRQNHLRGLMRGAWILSLGALITKILSAVYRVPFQNIVGDTGFYVYQQVYPLYALAVVLALSGGPVYISKRVAAAVGREKKAAAQRALALLLVFCGVIFVSLLLFAPQIAGAMADVRLAPLIRTVAWLYLLVPFMAVTRGYFQGHNDMVATASSQVVEQIVRVAIIILAAVVGHMWHWSIYLIGTIAMGGALAGGLVVTRMLLPRMSRELDGELFPRTAPAEGWGTYTKTFFSEGGALVLFSALMILFQLVDSFTITKGLQQSGLTAATARELKGIYDRGQPFVQLGLVVATALAQGLLPALTIAQKKHAHNFYNRTAVMMLHLAVVSATLATTGLMALMPFANQLLFGNRGGTTSLIIYVVSVALVAAINAVASLLQSQDQFRTTTVAMIAGVAVKIALTTILTRLFGTAGAALATCLGLGMTLALVYRSLSPIIRFSMWQNGFRRRLMCLALSVLVTGWIATGLIGSTTRFGALVACAMVGCICLLVAFWVSYRMRLLTVREILVLPGGSKVLRWFGKHQTK
mgnify:CR=1 FL=1